MTSQIKIPISKVKNEIKLKGETIKSFFEIFANKEYVILFLYLLHHPVWPYRIADVFNDAAPLRWETKQKDNYPLSLKDASRVSNRLKKMEEAKIVKCYKRETVNGRERKYYNINPSVLTCNMKIEIPCEYSSTKTQFNEIVEKFIEVIQEISPDEKSCVKKIVSYTEYDYLTIFAHFKNLLTEIVMSHPEKDAEKPFLDQDKLLTAKDMEGEKTYQTRNLFLCSRVYILLLSSIIMALVHEQRGMPDLTFSASWDFDHIT